MKNNLLLLSIASAIGISATGQAALLHLDKTSFDVYLDRSRSYLNWSTRAFGSLTLESGEIYASPIAFELDSAGNALSHDMDRGILMLAGTQGLFTDEGEHSFGRRGQEVRHLFQADLFPTPGETRTYRLYAGTNVFEDSENPNDYANDAFVDITLRFTDENPPVPEPASMAVLGLGALALLRRKKKA